MRTCIRASLLVLCSVAPVVAQSARDTSTTRDATLPVIVAEVREDGRIIPVGEWKGEWQRISYSRASATFATPRSWHYQPFVGTPRRLRSGRVILDTDRDDPFAHDGWGLASDFSRAKDIRHSFVRVGVATTSPLRVRFFTAAPDSVLTRLRPALLALMDSVARSAPPWGQGLLPLQAQDTVTIGARAARSADGAWLVELRAERPMGYNPRDTRCLFSVFYGSWAVVSAERVHFVTAPEIGDCDKGSSHIEASGMFELGARTFVLGVVQGYESRDSMIWEWSGADVRKALSRF